MLGYVYTVFVIFAVVVNISKTLVISIAMYQMYSDYQESKRLK